MPSSYTPNFNLNQWEAHDKVERIDFNADNAKIDAAFLNHPSAELIGRAAAETEIAKLTLDISQLDWSRYFMVILTVDTSVASGFYVTMGSGIENCAYIYRDATTPSMNTKISTSLYSSHMSMLIPVLYDGSHAPSAISFGSGAKNPDNGGSFGFVCGGGGQKPLNQCVKIEITRVNSKFKAGSCAALWGVK